MDPKGLRSLSIISRDRRRVLSMLGFSGPFQKTKRRIVNMATRAKVWNVKHGREYVVMGTNLVIHSAEIFVNARFDRTHNGPGLRLLLLVNRLLCETPRMVRVKLHRA